MTTIYTVDINTQEENAQGVPVYVVSTKEEALRRARYLNKREAFGVIIDEDGDVAECEHNDDVIAYGNEYKYYDTGAFEVDGPFYEEEIDSK